MARVGTVAVRAPQVPDRIQERLAYSAASIRRYRRVAA
jgi:hypothetical protein